MADAAEEKVPATAPASAGIPMKLVIIVAVVALVMGLGGAFAVVKLAGGNHANDEAKTDSVSEKKAGGHEEASVKTSGAHGSAPGAIFDLEPFIVNLADAPEIRYLKLTVKLEVDGADPGAELSPRVPQIRDSILVLLSSKDAAGIKTPQGKFQLRDEITKRVNDLLPKAAVRTAYFTEFVVQ
ncbi:Flagellar basal body-associated protein FliL [Nitrospira sp. KM1]|uniref:flagellar basal body-associated FliL family protein n=1 Tax=Nitrospira sp. KM1 TaxID=1936990 RepID=UPI0013A7B023|nr:flagellar basal body-associated FliL family protein [Nitrospira sp. KM1]BCA54809.1 Flagellar basal body-associated protein FliL [Nitrospira sp. KM1]